MWSAVSHHCRQPCTADITQTSRRHTADNPHHCWQPPLHSRHHADILLFAARWCTLQRQQSQNQGPVCLCPPRQSCADQHSIVLPAALGLSSCDKRTWAHSRFTLYAAGCENTYWDAKKNPPRKGWREWKLSEGVCKGFITAYASAAYRRGYLDDLVFDQVRFCMCGARVLHVVATSYSYCLHWCWYIFDRLHSTHAHAGSCLAQWLST